MQSGAISFPERFLSAGECIESLVQPRKRELDVGGCGFGEHVAALLN